MSFYLSNIAAGLRLCHAFLLAEPQRDRIRKNRLLIGAPAFFCILPWHVRFFIYRPMHVGRRSTVCSPDDWNWGALDGEIMASSLLGTKIEWIGFSHNATAGAYNYVDCSYMQILLENGLIPLVIIIAVYTYIMYMAVKEKDFYLQTAVLLITAFSITEPRLLNLAYNPLPFFGITYISLRGRSALFTGKATV